MLTATKQLQLQLAPIVVTRDDFTDLPQIERTLLSFSGIILIAIGAVAHTIGGRAALRDGQRARQPTRKQGLSRGVTSVTTFSTPDAAEMGI